MCTNRTAPPSGAPGRTAVAAGASSPGGSTAVPDGATEQASEETVPASGARSAAPKGTVGRSARVRAYPVGRHDAGLTLPAGQSATMNPRELRELIEALWSLAAPRKTR